MGKTDKQKANEKAKGDKKNAGKDKVKPKVPKVLKPGGGAVKKKKWSSSKSKDKLNLAVFWTKEAHQKLLKDILAKEIYVTPSKVSEKLKVNVSCARQALKELLDQEIIQPVDEYHSKYCCFVKGPKYVEEAKQKKEQPQGKEGGKKKDKQAKKEKGKKQ